MGEIGAGTGSSYPTTLDTDVTQEVNSPTAGKTKARAEVPNDLGSCIVKIETELGVDPAGTLTDVKTFLQTQHATDGTHGAVTATTISASGLITATGASSDAAAADDTLTIRRGQIGFPATQVASTNVNTLDDYEEGTWTPSLGGDTTYTRQLGTYTKIGRQVMASLRLTVNVLGTGATGTIYGLPFAANSTYYFAGVVSFSTGLAISVVSIAVVLNNSTQMSVYGRTAAAAADSPQAIFGNSADLVATISYHT